MTRVHLTDKLEEEFLQIKQDLADATYMKVSNPYVVSHLISFYKAHSNTNPPVNSNSAPAVSYQSMVASAPSALTVTAPVYQASPEPLSNGLDFGEMELTMED